MSGIKSNKRITISLPCTIAVIGMDREINPYTRLVCNNMFKAMHVPELNNKQLPKADAAIICVDNAGHGLVEKAKKRYDKCFFAKNVSSIEKEFKDYFYGKVKDYFIQEVNVNNGYGKVSRLVIFAVMLAVNNGDVVKTESIVNMYKFLTDDDSDHNSSRASNAVYNLVKKGSLEKVRTGHYKLTPSSENITDFIGTIVELFPTSIQDSLIDRCQSEEEDNLALDFNVEEEVNTTEEQTDDTDAITIRTNDIDELLIDTLVQLQDKVDKLTEEVSSLSRTVSNKSEYLANKVNDSVNVMNGKLKKHVDLYELYPKLKNMDPESVRKILDMVDVFIR